MDPSQLEPFELPITIKADLRKYQKDGISWLYFLNKYQLHGILCDDMGLGKTLQSICIMASDHHLRAIKFAQTKSPDAQHLPSLVVCPTSVTGHWRQEILQYTENLKPIVYAGPSSERKKIADQLVNHDIIITSYDVLRNDLHIFSPFFFNYCILDEGHIIKNAKTKITLAVKSIRAHHRLILSGTPVNICSRHNRDLLIFLLDPKQCS